MRSSTILIVCLVLALVVSTGAKASYPTSISVQGKLTDGSGVPLPAGAKTMIFRIFANPSGGSPIWPDNGGESQQITSDANGLWTAFVGANQLLGPGVFADSVRWLEVVVNATTLPRIRIVTGPSALRVATVDGATGGAISGSLRVGANNNAAGGSYAFVSGDSNSVPGASSAILGGLDNVVSGDWSVVVGGAHNRAFGPHSVILGGVVNQAHGDRACVAGGSFGDATGVNSFIGGGAENKTLGAESVALGGRLNTATGDVSFVAGALAYADNDNSFVWGDGTSATHTNADGSFLIRCSGGATFITNAASTSGVWLFANASGWSGISDSTIKENRQRVDGDRLLGRLASLPIDSWNYKAQGDSIRHIGPMAQDFRSAFEIGEDERFINSMDADGVALAAIQALYMRNRELEATVADLKSRLERLEEK